MTNYRFLLYLVLVQVLLGCQSRNETTMLYKFYVFFSSTDLYLIEVDQSGRIITTFGESTEWFYKQYPFNKRIVETNDNTIFNKKYGQTCNTLDIETLESLKISEDCFLKKHPNFHNTYNYIGTDDSWGCIIEIGDNFWVYDSGDVDMSFRHLLYRVLDSSTIENPEIADWLEYYRKWIVQSPKHSSSEKTGFVPIDSIAYSDKDSVIDILLTRYFYDNINNIERDGMFACDAYMVVNSSGKVVDATILYIHNELSYDAIELERMGDLLREVKFIMPQDVKQDSLYVCYVSLNSE